MKVRDLGRLAWNALERESRNCASACARTCQSSRAS